jgi:CheY-like chemotaxis protein
MQNFMNLLIVEDNLKMRQMIKSIVADLAERIDECSDGGDALEIYARHKPDWVLMDIRMEKVDGISATRQIIERFDDAKIIIVTNYDDAEIRKSARQAGACGFVLKENLLKVRELISKK